MQCKDIKDKDILNKLYLSHGKWTNRWDFNAIYFSHIPEKLLLSKMRKLIKKDLVGGCSCGCRGDYEITDKGIDVIDEIRIKPYTGY